MATKKEMNDKFYTTEGMNALNNRIKTLLKFFNNKNQQYPLSINLLGFGLLEVNGEKELYGRIRELSDIIHFSLREDLVEETYASGEKAVQLYLKEVGNANND